MNWLPPTLLFVVAWLAVFAQTQFPVLTSWLGVPLGFLPALVVYAALTHGLAVTSSLAVLAALWLDALSPSRLGVSVGPLFLLAFAVHTRQHLILRDQLYAQFFLGAAGGVLVPLATAGLLHLGNREPYTGPGMLWQLLVLGLFNGVMCPGCFRLFDRLQQTFAYPAQLDASFRSDREIVRGRH